MGSSNLRFLKVGCVYTTDRSLISLRSLIVAIEIILKGGCPAFWSPVHFSLGCLSYFLTKPTSLSLGYIYMIKTFADKIIEFNEKLAYHGQLPAGFRVINPYADNPETLTVMKQFYRKYYNDSNVRKFILGINPSRHGAGVTGIPFTDTKRLESICGIRMKSARTHEVSSVFMYEMISAYGGAERFYQECYINSLFPLAITRQTKNGKWLNTNYYDDPSLYEMTEDFMISSLRKQINFGLDTSEVFILGTKNAGYIKKINKKANLFGRLTILEHPRYIQQYKSKDKHLYINKYISLLRHST